MNDQSAHQKLEKSLTHSLNTHGFSFQYAILREAQKYYNEKKSPWAFEVSEFPVAVKETPTHIDFILRNTKEPFYVIAECKRANPALSHWCFVKAPYVSRKVSTREKIVRETINVDSKDKSKPPKVSLDWIERSENIYRLAFEIKSQEKGDTNQGRGQINDATTQVLRGLNGIIDFFVNFYSNTNKFPLGGQQQSWSRVSFIPVIFTSATLWVSDVDLSTANLETGKLDISSIKLEKREWIFYHHSQSPNIKHGFGSFKESEELSEVLYWEYTRTIPIVSSSGLPSFLGERHWWIPADWNGL